MGAFVTRVSLETFIRKGKITEGTNLQSRHLVSTSLQFLPGPLFQLVPLCSSTQWRAWVAPWVCWLVGAKALGSSTLHWKQNTLSLPQPFHQAGPIQGDQGPLSPREQGLFICFVHHHRPSPQKSGWHITGSLQIFIRWMNEWLNSPGSLHPSLLHSGWASWPLPFFAL